MPDSEKQTLNEILIHVGETRKGINGLEGNVQKIEKHLFELNHSTVRKDDCAKQTAASGRGIASLKQDLKADIGALQHGVQTDLQELKTDIRYVKQRTGDHPSIGHLVAQDGSQPAIPILPEPTKHGLKYWLAVIGGSITIVTFLGMVGYGLMHLGRKWEQMEGAMAATRKQQTRDMKKQEITIRQLQQAMQRLGKPGAMHGPIAGPPKSK